MVTKNSYLADLGHAIDSATANKYLTVDDSGGSFENIQYSQIVNVPNILDSVDVVNIADSAYVNARVDLSAYSTTSYVDTEISNLVGGAPANLDTLNELAAAINDDATFQTTITNLINSLPDSAQVSTIVTTDVDKAFVDALNVDADTLDGQQGTYYSNYNNLSNTPNVLDSAQVVALVAAAGNVTQSYVDAAVAALPDSAQVSGIITADVDKAFVDALNVDADTLDGQDGTYYLNYNNFTNTPNVLDSANVNTLVSAGIANVVDAAPASLDTLNELAAAINDDASFNTTITNAINALPDSSQVSGIITADVDKAFVDALNVDADTLDGQQGTYYLDYTNATNKPNILDSANITSIVDSAYVRARGWDSANTSSIVDSAYVLARGWDSGNTTSLIDSSYISARVTPNAGLSTFTYNTTSGQTSFTGADAASSTLSYNTGSILVFYNGILMKSGDDYTATDGSTITLTDPADSGGTMSIFNFGVGLTGSSGSAVSFSWGGDRWVQFGGWVSPLGTGSTTNSIEYNSISTPTTTADFGDLSSDRFRGSTAMSDTSRGVVVGGRGGSTNNSMDYVTISTTGNTTDFGDVKPSSSAAYGHASVSDGTYGVIANSAWDSINLNNTLQVITIQTTGNSTDYGNLNVSLGNPAYMAGVSDGTYGVYGGGRSTSQFTTMQYITIASSAGASDFGDLTVGRSDIVGVSDTTYGVFMGGDNVNSTAYNTMDYITIATTGNATDFGDLNQARSNAAGASDGTYGVYLGGAQNESLGFQYNTVLQISIATPGNSTQQSTATAGNKADHSATSGSAS